MEFFNIRDKAAIGYSDSICTALQLTNFYQDVSIDIQKGRIYIPLDEVEKFGVELNQFELKQNNANFELLLKYQIERCRQLFIEGRNLLPLLPGKLKKQISMTVFGGEKILCKIEELNYDVLNYRPVLSKFDYAKIFLKSLL